MATQPRGIRNNNPLNIRKGNSWQGEAHPQTDPAFEQFVSMEYGLRAAMLLLRTYITKHGCRTVKDIISRWAPPSENNTYIYTRSVCMWAGLQPSQIISHQDKVPFLNLVRAMARMECGVNLSNDLLLRAYDLAFHPSLV